MSGGVKLEQHTSLPESCFHPPHSFHRGYSLPILPVTACTPRLSPSDMSVIWAQVLSGGSFIDSFTTMEATGGFCHFYQRQNHSMAEQEDSF